jgi:hypothetical protein
VSSDVLLPVAITFALGVPIVLVLWRVFVVGGDLRRDAQLGRMALDIVHRTDISLGELAVVVDDLRRRKAEPMAIEASIKASTDALRRYAQEAEVVDKHFSAAGSEGLRPEIERAQRAVDLIEHGRGLMLDGSADGIAEGETSVKRGYLNMLHARDAIRARGEAIAAAADPAGAEARRRLRNH